VNKTIAVIGRSRRNGNTGRLIDLIANELKEEIEEIGSDSNIKKGNPGHPLIG